MHARAESGADPGFSRSWLLAELSDNQELGSSLQDALVHLSFGSIRFELPCHVCLPTQGLQASEIPRSPGGCSRGFCLFDILVAQSLHCCLASYSQSAHRISLSCRLLSSQGANAAFLVPRGAGKAVHTDRHHRKTLALFAPAESSCDVLLRQKQLALLREHQQLQRLSGGNILEPSPVVKQHAASSRRASMPNTTAALDYQRAPPDFTAGFDRRQLADQLSTLFSERASFELNEEDVVALRRSLHLSSRDSLTALRRSLEASRPDPSVQGEFAAWQV